MSVLRESCEVPRPLERVGALIKARGTVGTIPWAAGDWKAGGGTVNLPGLPHMPYLGAGVLESLRDEFVREIVKKQGKGHFLIEFGNFYFCLGNK